MWILRANEELRGLYKYLDIVGDIENKRIEWTGHVVRMDQGMTVKKIFECKPEDRTASVVRVSGYRYRGLGFDSRRYQIF